MNHSREKFIFLLSIVDTIKTGIRVFGTVIIFYFAFDTLKVFAPSTSVKVDFITNIAATISITLAVPGYFYGYIQRRFRKKEVARLTARIEKFEKLHDPNRTSSGLQPTGENPSCDF